MRQRVKGLDGMLPHSHYYWILHQWQETSKATKSKVCYRTHLNTPPSPDRRKHHGQQATAVENSDFVPVAPFRFGPPNPQRAARRGAAAGNC